MAKADLTNLAKVKGWLLSGQQTAAPPDETLIRSLISFASVWAQRVLSVDIVPQVKTITRNGDGQGEMWLPNRPILSVSSVTVDGVVVPLAASSQAAGFLFDENKISLIGWAFRRGVQNVTVSWQCGFQTGPEAQTIPSDGTPLSVLRLDLPWVSDGMVTFTDGLALTPTTDKDPSAGYYRIDLTGQAPAYQFSEADKTLPILITYGYCPPDIEQGVIEVVGQAAMRRTRIGITSKTFADLGADVFSTKDMDAVTATAFNQFKNVIPVY